MDVNSAQKTQDVSVYGPASAENEAAVSSQKKAELSKQQTEKKAEETASVAEIEEVASDLNEYMDDLQTDLGFFINEELNDQVIVEIKNRKTNELVKQIPSEEIVEIREKMAELTGLLLDKSI